MGCGMTREELYERNTHELRTLGRRVGVKCPSKLKKEDLVDSILKIEKGLIAPYHTNMGRPIKKGSTHISLSKDDVEKIEQLLKKFKQEILTILKNRD